MEVLRGNTIIRDVIVEREGRCVRLTSPREDTLRESRRRRRRHPPWWMLGFAVGSEVLGDTAAELFRCLASLAKPFPYLLVLEATAQLLCRIGSRVAKVFRPGLQFGIVEYLAECIAQGAKQLAKVLAWRALFLLPLV